MENLPFLQYMKIVGKPTSCVTDAPLLLSALCPGPGMHHRASVLTPWLSQLTSVKCLPECRGLQGGVQGCTGI